MKQEHIPYLLVAVPLLPLLAAILNTVVFALTQRSEKTKVQYWTILISIGATLLALGAHFSVMQLHPRLNGEASASIVAPLNWLAMNAPMRLEWAVRYDALTSIMVAVVLFVALMVQIFSVGYLHDRKSDYARYFAWLSFFLFSMLTLVVAGNMFLFFAGWAMDALGIKRFRLVLSYTRGDDPKEADHTFEYADIGEAEIEAYRSRIIAAKHNTYLPTDTRPGPWCKHCEAIYDCVSQNGALKVVTGKFVLGVVTVEDVTRHWHRLKQAETVVADALAQMKQLVIDSSEPIPLPGGRQLVATQRRGASKLNGDMVHHVLKDLYGNDVAEAAVEVTTKVSRDSIKKALDLALSTVSKAKMMEEIEELVAGMGGVSRGDDVTVVKEVNEKE